MHYKVNTLQAINNGFLKTDKKLIYIIYDFMKIERLSLLLDFLKRLDLARYVQWLYEIWLEITKCQGTSGGNYFQSDIVLDTGSVILA